jgi:hypothetical protein
MTRKKLLSLTSLLSLIAVIQINAQQTIEGFQAPESNIKHGDKLFVSNIGGAQFNPTALDSNGFISELTVDGKMLRQKFQKTILNGPKGLAVIKNVLYTADINRVVGFDINNGEQVFELNIRNAAMLNDLCAVDDSHLVVSESVGGKVYIINTSNKSYNFLGSIGGANGVTYDAKTKRLYACGMGAQSNGSGKLYVKNLNGKDTLFTELPDSPTGVFDGLEMTDDTHLLATDWIRFNSDKGRFVVYDLKNHTVTSYPFEQGSADICYDKDSRKIFIPVLTKNKVVIIDFNSLKKE